MNSSIQRFSELTQSLKVNYEECEITQSDALLDQLRFDEFLSEAEKIKKYAKTMQDWQWYHLIMETYAQKIGNEQLEKQEHQLAEQLKAKIEEKTGSSKETATARQCKQAFRLWSSFAAFLLLLGGVSACFPSDSIFLSVGAGAIILSGLAFLVTMAWLVVWMIRRSKERHIKEKK